MTDANKSLAAVDCSAHDDEECPRFIACPECGGEGVCAYDKSVIDYTHGGYLEEVIDTCDLCDGSGEIEDDE